MAEQVRPDRPAVLATVKNLVTRIPSSTTPQGWTAPLVAGLVLAVAMPILETSNLHSPVRVALAVLFALTIPGIPVAALLGIRRFDVAVTVATATSIAVNLLVPLALLQAGLWHPLAAEIISGGICVALTSLVLRPTLTARTAATA